MGGTVCARYLIIVPCTSLWPAVGLHYLCPILEDLTPVPTGMWAGTEHGDDDLVLESVLGAE